MGHLMKLRIMIFSTIVQYIAYVEFTFLHFYEQLS